MRGDAVDRLAGQVLAARAEATRRLFAAMMLAPTVQVCEALLRGEQVPVDRLDATWLRRFGRRTR